jgi:hypothetical protein
MLPLPDKVFYAGAILWFALIAFFPRGMILVLSLGQSRMSDRGVIALRWIGGLFTLVAFANLAPIYFC